MEANKSLNQSVHVHNYSTIAVRTLISLIKLHPIIFDKSNDSASFTAAHITLAWHKIVASLMNDLDLARQRYWAESFQAVWKWIRSVLIKDLLARRSHRVQVKRPDINLLADLKFLEPFIHLDEISSIEIDDALQSGKDVQMKIPVSEIADLREHIRKRKEFWIMDSTETEDYRSTLIIIYFRVNHTVSMAFNVEKPPNLNDSSTPSKVDEIIKIGSSNPCTSSDHTTKPTLTLYATCGSFPRRLPSFQDTFNSKYIQNEEPAPSTEEDYEYIMSLLPKLSRLRPEENKEARTFMMRAALNLFTQNQDK